MPETILIVDDEEPVRRTFRDWLATSGLSVEVHAVPDAESALVFANQHPIDLAVLDWNLGTGSDGLRLLEDLVEFHPDLVAILVTGFAHQATPLDALRMGVRDYLDKNQDLNRETFLASVRRQLERIIPAKRHREFMQGLLQFRQSVEQILPLVQSATTLNDPVPLPEAVRQLFRFLIRSTAAADGVLLGRHVATDDAPERFLAFGPDGKQLASPTVPFHRSLAATVLSMNEPCVMSAAELRSLGPVELQPFERNRQNILAAPIPVASGVHVVLELFDKPGGFSPEDRKLVAAAAEFSSELLRQAMSERQTRRLLIDAVEAALKASEQVSAVLPNSTLSEPSLPPTVMDKLRAGLDENANAVVDSETSLELAEAVRELAVKHGPAAVRHCTRVIRSVHEMLDETTGQ